MADTQKVLRLLKEVKDRLNSLRKSETDPLRKSLAWCAWGAAVGACVQACESWGRPEFLKQNLEELSVLEEVVRLARVQRANDPLFEAVNRAWRLVLALDLILSKNAGRNTHELPILTRQAI